MKPFHVLCVFHKEKTPSLRIWPSGHYKCYGCGEEGETKNHPVLAQEVRRRRVEAGESEELEGQALLEQAGQLRFPWCKSE